MTEDASTTEQGLRAVVRANRDDPIPRLVYADWLDEQSGPVCERLAAYIRLECEWLSRPSAESDARFRESIPHALELCRDSPHPLGGWEYAEEIERIRAKIEALRKADPTHALFGVRKWGNYGHDYEMRPALQEPDLLQFEEKLGFPLPAAYRAFLLHIGDGPMGPYYGLLPIGLTSDVEPLQRAFPFNRADAGKAEIAWREKRWSDMPHFDDDQSDDGHLFLCEHGCGMYNLMALNGDTRGWIWFSGDGCELFVERNDAGEPLTFLQWYEAWLDHSLNP
jgi:uncharacterized protein (TIGR02996 family)